MMHESTVLSNGVQLGEFRDSLEWDSAREMILRIFGHRRLEPGTSAVKPIGRFSWVLKSFEPNCFINRAM